MSKSLAVVTSEWAWDICFNFSYGISDFYFGKDLGGIEAENIHICLDYLVIFL